jgi:hypothetical protein
MYEEYSKPPPPDHMRTFTNLVVKKEDPSKKRVVNTHHGSRRLLAPVAAKPAMWTQDAAAFKSATRLKQPHLRSTLAAKDSVFMTGVDASEAGNESSSHTHAEYPHIDSVAYQQSQLASDLEPRRVLVGQLHGMLRCINTKSQKSLAVLDSNIERQVELDVTILSKENDALAKELNELIFKK